LRSTGARQHLRAGARRDAWCEAARLTLPEYLKNQSFDSGSYARLSFLLARRALMMRIASPSPVLLMV
jgi:hypothetical protein